MSISVIRPQVGLALSIGLPPQSEGNPGYHPAKLSYFRPKPGELMQYAAAADRFTKVYGAEPKQVDVLFVSDNVGLNLDIRPKVFGQSGLKALGTRNLAELPADEFNDALYAYTETLDVYPDDDGEIIQRVLTGAKDPLVERVVTKNGKSKVVKDCKFYGVLRFSVPEVTGLMTLVEISTTSRRSMANLYAGIHMAQALTGGILTGIPFVLSVRPKKGRYLDPVENKKKSTTFYELALDSRDSYRDVWELAMERRALAAPAPMLELAPIDHADLDRDAELISPARAIEAATEVPTVNVETFDTEDPGDFEVPGGPWAGRPIAEVSETIEGEAWLKAVLDAAPADDPFRMKVAEFFTNQLGVA